MLNNPKLRNYVISIGCNYNGSLSGCVNDSIAMYNTFYKLNNVKNYILNDEDEVVTTEKIKDIVKKIHNSPQTEDYRIIFTFAGHGHTGGKIQLSSEIIDYKTLYEILNYESKRLFNLLIILDSCYSGGFINLKTYKNISDITVITSCSSSQKSAESMSDKLRNYKGILDFKSINDCFYIGVFTYNFTSIVDNLIDTFKELTIENIFRNDIWNLISEIANQSYQIK
tara:strand:+ start:68 stop:745 length:678 start_codon:yes stop_codon:yes gene_type:complete